jgi:hypothetical protein
MRYSLSCSCGRDPFPVPLEQLDLQLLFEIQQPLAHRRERERGLPGRLLKRTAVGNERDEVERGEIESVHRLGHAKNNASVV